MSVDLKKRHEEILVSMASCGQLDEFLPPHLWEELRQRLQRLYRKATGEPMAVLSVEHTPSPETNTMGVTSEELAAIDPMNPEFVDALAALKGDEQ